MKSLLRLLAWPFRLGSVCFPRGFVLRSLSVAVLKPFSHQASWMHGLAEVRPMDRRDLSFEPSDSMVMRAVYWFGVQGYEGVLADTWVRLCTASENVLEVGGNVGLYAVLGAQATKGNYTVVEPVPEIVKVLQANLRRNRLVGTHVLEAAVIPGRQEQTVQLNIPEEGSANPVGSHLLVDGEVSGRTTERLLSVQGLPFVRLVDGKDLIKIDAEGIEFALLSSVVSQLEADRPTLLIEVLPEAVQLGAFLSELAQRCGYLIHVVPGYGSDQIVAVPAAQFNSATPGRFKSKDVILAARLLEGAIAS